MATDGHHPMHFLCDDGHNYFLKYRIGIKPQEIDFLVYEIVCHYLLKYLEIPTPEIALVTIQKDSYNLKDIKHNKKIKPGTICFGSKEIAYADLLRSTEIVKSKPEFKRFGNPADLIKIAVFDLWVDNTDRGRNDNFNILITREAGKNKFVAFDNAFAFKGVHGLQFFNPKQPINTDDKLFITSFFNQFVKHFSKYERTSITKNVLNLIHDDCKNDIDIAFKQIPTQWEISYQLKERILNFLFDSERLEQITNIALCKMK